MRKIRLMLLVINIIILGFCIREIFLNNQLKNNEKKLVSLEKEYNQLIDKIDSYTKLKEKYKLIDDDNVSLEEKKNNLNIKIDEKNKEIDDYNNKISSLNSNISKLSWLLKG